jgi:acetyltransferase-like isoleucine patch superfamily enzyme
VVTIGSNSFLGDSLLVCAERIDIGDDVLISWGGTVVDHDSHSLDFERRRFDVERTLKGEEKDWSCVKVRPVRICNRVWIGFNVAILRGVTIGEGAVVGACSVVTKDVAPYTVVAGNPARFVREISREA